MQDPEYLLRFADRWFDLRENKFATSNLMQEIDDNVTILTDGGALDNPADRNFLEPSVSGDTGRWDIDTNVWPNYYDDTHTNTTYMDYVNNMKTYITNRLDWMDGEIAATFGSDPPILKINGVTKNTGAQITSLDTLTIVKPTGAGGTIYYTLDGSDPHDRGSTPPSSSAIQYTGAITLNNTTHVKARILNGSSWSAMNKATYYEGDLSQALVITEIMYHPADGGAEYIELQNVSNDAIDLSEVYFVDGIDFTFPAGTVLQPGEYIVIVSAEDEALFTSQYPGVTIFGTYNLRLDNGGETIAINDANDASILIFAYNDIPPWPLSADGDGYSLVLIGPDADPSDPNSWRISNDLGGSPGEADFDHSTIYVDFGDPGPWEGSFDYPFDTFQKAQNAVTLGGTILVAPGTSSETPAISKEMRIEVNGSGTVRIGDITLKTGGASKKWSLTDWLGSVLDIFGGESDGGVYPESEVGY